MGSRDVLAIVGSTHWPDRTLLVTARHVIEEVLDAQRPDAIVSGGAIGIDTLAREIGDERAIPVIEHLPRHRRWKPAGYEERNMLIARDCTRLLCIRHGNSRTYGSGWTADYAASLGRPVDRIFLGA